MFSKIFFCLVTLFVGVSLGHNCGNVVTIESQGILNYLANVSFTAPHNFSGEWVMDMVTDVPYTFLGGREIWVSSNAEEGKANFRSRKNDLEINQGDFITFRFRISWGKGHGETRPEAVSLIWDGEELCGNDEVSVNQEARASRASSVLDRVGPRGRRYSIY